MLNSVNSMLYGHPSESIAPGDPLRWSITPLALNIVFLVGLGITLPSGVLDFLGQVLRVLGVS
jgi:hypothetical protein